MTAFCKISVVLFVVKAVASFSELGLHKFELNEKNSLASFAKSLYNNSKVYVQITLQSKIAFKVENAPKNSSWLGVTPVSLCRRICWSGKGSFTVLF